HYLAVGSATLLTNHITGKSAFNYTDFTTAAVLSSEYVAFVVKTDSPIQSGRDLAARLRKDPAAASIAVSTSAGNTSHIAAALVGRTAGADARKMKIVVFNSGGDSMTALLGGHIDVVTISAAGAVPQAQGGKVRIIGLAAARRLHGALAEVPTWKEQGIDVVVDNFRSLKGPRGMNPAQIAYWEEVAAKLVNTDEWKTEVDRNFRAMNYMRSKESRTYLEAQYRELRAVLVELGLAK
ncbi:MAG: tripartite tricarboxylate transporter substrate binding protein, partial [Betaproteobacteria bacterium]|nr:tripartite tricarboxylate transporter substrate binding protein [Betaproteobacteria bacterium]